MGDKALRGNKLTRLGFKNGGSAVSKGGGITHKPQKKLLGILGPSKETQKKKWGVDPSNSRRVMAI